MRKSKYVNNLLDLNSVSVQIIGIYKDPDEESVKDIWYTIFSADYEYNDGMIKYYVRQTLFSSYANFIVFYSNFFI